MELGKSVVSLAVLGTPSAAAAAMRATGMEVGSAEVSLRDVVRVCVQTNHYIEIQ